MVGTAQKLTPEKVLAIVELCEAGFLTQWEIAKLFHISQSLVSKIWNGHAWRWLTGIERGIEGDSHS